MKPNHKNKPLSATGSLFIFLAVGVLGAGFPTQTFAQVGSGVSVAPKAILFQDRQRSAEVTLMNKSTVPVTYRVFFKNMRMLENGRLVQVKNPEGGEQFADKLIRYSPRQVTVPGGGSQSVRLVVRKPSNLPAGEYRSHLVFRALPPPDTGADIEQKATNPGEIEIKMVTVLSLSIPITVWHGETSATAQLSDLSIKPGDGDKIPPQLILKVKRQGNRTASGNLSVIYRLENGDELEVGRINGLAVYFPLPARTARVRLNLPDGVTLNGGELHVTYRDRVEKNKGALLAEAKLAVP